MTHPSENGVVRDQAHEVGNLRLDTTPFATRRPRKRREANPLMIGACVFVTATVAAAIFVWLAPNSAIMDSLNGATPNLSDAEGCLRSRNFPCAEADYRAYLRKYPRDASATAILAIVLTQDGHHQDALPYYRRALALGVSTYDLHANYAIILNSTGHLDDSIVQNYAALSLVPSLVDVRGSLADQLVQKGRGKEAIGLLESFDQNLIDQGQTPYFPARITEIRNKLGMSPEPQVAPDTNTPTAASDAAVEVRLEALHGALYVPAVVDGSITLKFMVDSGASDVCIPADVARTLMRMGKLTQADRRGAGAAVLANGSQVMAEKVMLESIQVGSHKVKNVLASVVDTQGSLLLGQSFLSRFKNWSVDNDRKVLVLRN